MPNYSLSVLRFLPYRSCQDRNFSQFGTGGTKSRKPCSPVCSARCFHDDYHRINRSSSGTSHGNPVWRYCIARVNRSLRGWYEYFKHSHKPTFREDQSKPAQDNEADQRTVTGCDQMSRLTCRAVREPICSCKEPKPSARSGAGCSRFCRRLSAIGGQRCVTRW